MGDLPVPSVVRLPDGTHIYADQAPAALSEQPAAPQVVHQHIHQAPPDRTVQRIALGSGAGAGAVAATVVLGPMLVGALTAIAVDLAVVAFIVVAVAWGVVTMVRFIGGPEGKAAAGALRRRRRGGR